MAETRRSIGPAGRLARIGVGLALIGLALFWWEPSWLDAALGLLVMPLVVLGALAIRAKHSRTQLSATGPVGHALSLAIPIPLLLFPVTAGAAALFYGVSMLVAGARSIGGCEITAISNIALRRDDQLGCALFAPVDGVERQAPSPGPARS